MIFCIGDISKVKILYNQLMKLGCRLEDEVIVSLIGLYGKQRMLKDAQDVFEVVFGSSRPGKLILKSIIDAYAKCGKPEEAYSVYKEATANGQDLDAVAISILVNTLTNYGMIVKSSTIKPFVPSLIFLLGSLDFKG